MPRGDAWQRRAIASSVVAPSPIAVKTSSSIPALIAAVC
jgi:hypothetical protein